MGRGRGCIKTAALLLSLIFPLAAPTGPSTTSAAGSTWCTRLRLRGGGYAYQAPGRRPYVERHTPG
jgi:hypothetical protein